MAAKRLGLSPLADYHWPLGDVRPDLRPGADIELLAAVADLMHYLDRFYGASGAAAHSRLERLLGFPVRPGGRWQDRAGSAARRVEMRAERHAHVAYVLALPPGTAAVYERARTRLRREYAGRAEACERVWVPMYGYLLDHGLSDIRTDVDPDRLPALPGRTAAQRERG